VKKEEKNKAREIRSSRNYEESGYGFDVGSVTIFY
jgi:hypothetical protein